MLKISDQFDAIFILTLEVGAIGGLTVVIYKSWRHRRRFENMRDLEQEWFSEAQRIKDDKVREEMAVEFMSYANAHHEDLPVCPEFIEIPLARRVVYELTRRANDPPTSHNVQSNEMNAVNEPEQQNHAQTGDHGIKFQAFVELYRKSNLIRSFEESATLTEEEKRVYFRRRVDREVWSIWLDANPLVTLAAGAIIGRSLCVLAHAIKAVVTGKYDS